MQHVGGGGADQRRNGAGGDSPAPDWLALEGYSDFRGGDGAQFAPLVPFLLRAPPGFGVLGVCIHPPVELG
ncbi:MAG: hypothetical protein IPG49_18435 [Proteobacteria bacterium]|nr:hypothetical protein [Pseudomonadota bacterium]